MPSTPTTRGSRPSVNSASMSYATFTATRSPTATAAAASCCAGSRSCPPPSPGVRDAETLHHRLHPDGTDGRPGDRWPLLAPSAISASGDSWRRERVNAVAIELAGWLDTVRRASTKGNACQVTISGGSLPAGATLATATQIVTAQAIASTCLASQPLAISALPRATPRLSPSRRAAAPASSSPPAAR